MPHDVSFPVWRRGEVAQAGVSPLPVVENLDVLPDVRYGFLPGTILSKAGTEETNGRLPTKGGHLDGDPGGY